MQKIKTFDAATPLPTALIRRGGRPSRIGGPSSSGTPTGRPSRRRSHSSFAGVPLAQRGRDDALLRTPLLAAETPIDTDPPPAADPPLDP